MRADGTWTWLKPKPLPDAFDEEGLSAEVEEALRAQRAEEALIALVNRWFDEGLDEGQVLGLLYRVQDRIREQCREADDDVLTEVISCLVGWCGSRGVIQRPT
jgi:hypothetical protein